MRCWWISLTAGATGDMMEYLKRCDNVVFTPLLSDGVVSP